MIIFTCSNLDKQDSISKPIDNGLPATDVPPLDRAIELSSSHDNPIGSVLASDSFNQRRLALFLIREMDVAGDPRRLDVQTQLFIQVLDKPVHEVERALIGKTDQRIAAFDPTHARALGIHRRYVRIVLP